MKLISISWMQSGSFEREFLRSIDRGLAKFGESRARLVYSKFEVDYNLGRTDIFGHPELFSATIRNVFRFACPYVERSIVSELKGTFSLADREYKGLADAVQEIKASCSTISRT
jgi:hypothetical protein